MRKTEGGECSVHIRVFFAHRECNEILERNVCAATPTTNPGTSTVSLGIQALKEHQDSRDSYVCRFINFDKSDQAREPKLCLQLGPEWSFPLLEFVDCDTEELCD